jgi:transposase
LLGEPRFEIPPRASQFLQSAAVTSTGATCGDAIVAASPRIEALPAYAPDVNPVEWAWPYLKHAELRSVTCLDLEELQLQLHLAIARLRQKGDIVRSFFAGAGLSF